MRILSMIVAILVMAFAPGRVSALTAEQALDKAAAKVRGAAGISCSFTLTSGGRSARGTLKSAGTKFAIFTPVSSSWYDGKTMWTYNPSTAETTMMTPTADEIAETNPMAYLSGWKSSYGAAFAKGGTKGKYTVVLTPKRRHSAVKSVTVTLNSAFVPERFAVTASNGSVTTVAVSGVNLKARFAASEFTYPKKRYPKAEIIDLR